MSNISNLQDLIEQLKNCEDKSPENIAKVIEKINLDTDKISSRCIWDENKYTRNLVYRDDYFEVLLLCWKQSQNSPIHDHSGSSCWMKILQGSGREEIYTYDLEGNNLQNLKLIDSKELEAGEFVYINDEVGVHRVFNSGEQDMITLHIYAKPIGSCLRYKSETQETQTAEFENDYQIDLKGI